MNNSKIMSRLTNGVALLTLAQLASPAAAQDENDRNCGASTCDVIVVSATVNPLATDALGVSTDIIDADAIRRTGASTIDELLRSVPNVQLPLSNQNAGFPANPSVAIRGLGLGDNGTRTLVLIDEVPANGGFFGNVFWNRVPIDIVERIEVVRGGGSGVHGAFAQGGVISLQTRAPGDELELRSRLEAGSFDSYSTDFGISGSLTTSLRAGVSYSYSESAGFFEVVSEQRGPVDQRTSFENGAIRGHLEFDASEALELFIRGGYYEQSQRGTTRLARTESEAGDIVAGATARLARGTLEARFFYQDEEFGTENPRVNQARDDEFLSFASISESDDYGASLVWTMPTLGPLDSLSIGIDGRIIDGTNRAATLRPDGSIFLEELNRGEQRSLAVFLEAALSPFEGNSIVLNVRGDFFRNGDATEIENGGLQELPTNKFEEISFRAAVSQRILPDVRLRGAVYRSFRAPTLAELYRSFGSSSFQGLANPLLDAETLLGGELGFAFNDAGGRSLEVTAFRNTVDDFVGAVPVAFFPVFTIKNTNLGEIRSQGVEVIGRLQLGRHLKAKGGYVYLDTEVRENPLDGDLIGNRIEGAPRHSLTWGLEFDGLNGLSANLQGRYLTAQFQDVGNETRLGAHTVLDFRIAYEFGENLELFLVGQNILDEEYEASALGGVVQRGTPASVSVGVSMSL